MSVLGLLLKICAIDWFIVETGSLRSQGAFIYPPDMAETIAQAEQVGVPHLVFKIRCKEQ